MLSYLFYWEDVFPPLFRQWRYINEWQNKLTPYIEINEVLSNDSSIIYSIKGADSPGSDGAELPSKVMTYKGKYLCFIELDEQEMSRTELFEKGIVADSNFHENLHLDDGWVLALRKYENGSTLVKKVLSSAFLFEYPQLW